MNQTISPKLTVLTFGVLVILFVAGFYIFAWQEPTQAPPGGNVATPINVGPTGQSKEGGLILNTGGAANGLVIDKGNLCLGIDCRNVWPTGGGPCVISGNNIVCSGIPDSTTGSLSITKNSVTCPIWKDCDGDGKTYGSGDCDESCSTCSVGSSISLINLDGKDQNCDGVVDEKVILEAVSKTCSPPQNIALHRLLSACRAYCEAQGATMSTYYAPYTKVGAGYYVFDWNNCSYDEYDWDENDDFTSPPSTNLRCDCTERTHYR